MFIHSIFIVKSTDQHILYGRHFVEEPNQEKANEWQEALYNATAATWQGMKPEEPLIAVIQNKFVVYMLVGEVIIFVASQENNADELGCKATGFPSETRSALVGKEQPLTLHQSVGSAAGHRKCAE